MEVIVQNQFHWAEIKLEDRTIEIIRSEQQSLRDPWDYNKTSNTLVIRVWEGRGQNRQG